MSLIKQPLAVQLSAVVHEGIAVQAPNGTTAFLAVVDDTGQVIEAGPQIARLAFDVSIACFKNYLKGEGYLRTYARPPDDSQAA